MITDDWSSLDTDDEDNEDQDAAGSWFPTGRGLWQTSAKLFSDPEPRMKQEHANQLADNQPQDRCAIESIACVALFEMFLETKPRMKREHANRLSNSQPQDWRHARLWYPHLAIFNLARSSSEAELRMKRDANQPQDW